jgi:hypothetical protein
MRKIIKHSISFLLVFIAINTFAQNNKVKGYRIDGDEIVFSFDKRDYKTVTKDDDGLKTDFNDIDINNVVVSGEFNNWSLNKWRMIKLNENQYELRKKIEDFTDEFSWEFKFVINNRYWAEPSKEAANITEATKYGINLNVYNLNFTTAYINKNGNAKFKLKGFKNADKVILSGTFNRWNEKYFKMIKTEDGWELALQLKPGEYEYKFIVDGKWMEDPTNQLKKKNEFNGFNSVIKIYKWVTFHLNSNLNAKKVILSGSFNDWNENNYKMNKTKNGWEYKLKLFGGKYHYKFIVDDNWIVDPENPVKEYDYNGNINSVYIVK